MQTPFYRFMIHGGDPRRPKDERGFYTARDAYTATQAKAAEKVLRPLEAESTTGVSASISRAIHRLCQLKTFAELGGISSAAPNRGSTFYSA